jgi:hypothetical protein
VNVYRFLLKVTRNREKKQKAFESVSLKPAVDEFEFSSPSSQFQGANLTGEIRLGLLIGVVARANLQAHLIVAFECCEDICGKTVNGRAKKEQSSQ